MGFIASSRVRIPLSPPTSLKNAPVAQLDRVPGCEPGGREFESLRARHNSYLLGVVYFRDFVMRIVWLYLGSTAS